jgi:hypothetical protein
MGRTRERTHLQVMFPLKPPSFAPDAAPVGVQIRWFATWATRRKIVARLLLVHTNAARGPASLNSIYTFGSIDGNTKPTYQVQGDGTAGKFLPSNVEQSANYKANPFSLSIETQDDGWPTPGDIRWKPAQAERIAEIIAFESIVNGFPIETPDTWDGSGVGAHTDPFGYPLWTNSQGKVCPGSKRKAQLRDEVMPRARAIRDHWLAPPPPIPESEEDDEDMVTTRKIFKAPATKPNGVSTVGFPWIVEFSNGDVRALVNNDVSIDNIPIVELDWSQYRNLAHSAGCGAVVGV